jgi:hypothetical protein
MGPWNGAPIDPWAVLGPQPNVSDPCQRYSATFKQSQVCATHNLNVNTCATFDLPLTFAMAPHRA